MGTRKNVHAVAMGRKGGRSRSAAKIAAVRQNARKGGRPVVHKIETSGVCARVMRYDPRAKHWLPITQLTPRALDVLAEWMRTNRAGEGVTIVEDGCVYFESNASV